MSPLEAAIDQLGEELVNCDDGCVGIWYDRAIGLLPRCLILERPDAGGIGCLAVGLNPGASNDHERGFYVRSGAKYSVVKAYWHSNIAQIPYYSKARRVIDQIGLTGPIIWSDLAKCENPDGVKQQPPVQTLRHCTQSFLRRELELASSDWPVLAIGWEAYKALSYLVPARPVIGIPHSSGAWAAYAELFADGSMKREVYTRAVDALQGEPKAAWLGRTTVGA